MGVYAAKERGGRHACSNIGSTILWTRCSIFTTPKSRSTSSYTIQPQI